MNKSEVLRLSRNHLIGLHTHSHFFNFDKLSKNIQRKEILNKKKILEKIINKKIIKFFYPIGKYNQDSLKVLKDLKIKFAFKNNKTLSDNNFLIPRININKL